MEGGGPTSTVRGPEEERPACAGTERQVYVSFDDGDRWQSLRLNMAASSVRDLTVKDDDLIAATHGRGFWILDDVTPLRQIDVKTADSDAVLFQPQAAYRVRWNTNTDTPLPPDEPNAPNPPEGAIINYYLKSAASGPVTLEILQQDDRLVRRYSSTDPIAPIPDPSTSTRRRRFSPAQAPVQRRRMHRFRTCTISRSERAEAAVEACRSRQPTCPR